MRYEITPETLEEFKKHFYDLHDALIQQTEIRITKLEDAQCNFEVVLTALDGTIDDANRWTTLILNLQNVERFDLVRGRNADFSVILDAGFNFFDGHIYLSLFGDIAGSQSPSEFEPRRFRHSMYIVAAEKCFWEILPFDYDKEKSRLNIPNRVTDFDLAPAPAARNEFSLDTLTVFKDQFGSLRKSQIRTITIGLRGRPTWGLNARVSIAAKEPREAADADQNGLIFEIQNLKKLDLTHWGRYSSFPVVDEVNVGFFYDNTYLSFSGTMGPAAFNYPESFDEMSVHNGKKIVLIGEKCWWRAI